MILALGWRNTMSRDRRLAVPSAGVADVLGGIGHIAEVGDADLRSVLVGHHQRLVLFGLEELIGGAQLPRIPRTGDLAFGLVGVGVGEGRGDLIDADVIFVDRIGIQFHAHRGQRAAINLDLSDSVDLRDFLRQNRVRGIVHRGLGCGVGGEDQNQNRRIRRVGFSPGGIGGKIRRQKRTRGVDGRLYVARGPVDIAVQIELQRNVVEPMVLDDVISVTPAMRVNCFSSGVATDEAMVSGARAGQLRRHWMVGKSTGEGGPAASGMQMTRTSRPPR